MYKIKNSYIDRIIRAKASKAEIAFLLHIALSQDDHGVVQSVYYREACPAIGVSIQKFYEILSSLKGKGLIEVSKENKADFQVRLVGNDFSNLDFSGGYVKVAEMDFRNKAFSGLRAGAQLLYLHMLRYEKGKHMLLENFYGDYCALLGVGKKTLRSYVRELRQKGLLNVAKKRNKAYNYEVTMRASKRPMKKSIVPHEKDGYASNIMQMIRANFRRWVSPEDEKAISDIGYLSLQQRFYGMRKFPKMLMEAVRSSFSQQRREGRKEAKLNAALVNEHLTRIDNCMGYAY